MEGFTSKKLPAVPFETEISASSNPVTSSLNVMVTGIGDTLVGSVVEEDTITVGCAHAVTLIITTKNNTKNLVIT